jgi:phage terminase small subunit
MSLTDKQKRFCEEYMIDLNATQACIRAGYSQDTANVQGAQNLSKLNIQEYISELQKSKSNELNITFNDIATGVYNIAIDGEAKDNDKLKAYDQLSKMFGHYSKDNDQRKPAIIIPNTITFERIEPNSNKAS